MKIPKCLSSKSSQKAALILAEATITSIVGMIHGSAGIALTYGLAIAHIYFER